MTALVKYEAACRAIAECNAIDEAADLRERALFTFLVGQLTGDRALQIDAAEVAIRAERRIGTLLNAGEVA